MPENLMNHVAREPAARSPHEPAKAGPHLIMTGALFVLIITLAAALPARTALDRGRTPLQGVSTTCESPACLAPRQIITSKEAARIKHWLGRSALLVDIRADAESSSRIALESDTHVPFMEPPPATASNTSALPVETEFHVDFAPNVDEALRAAHMRYDDPVILMSPTSEHAVLAALLLQEHGYSRIYVMRD